MEMTLKDYEINKSKILDFLHGIKYNGPEFVPLLQVDVPEITFLVFNYIFFRFSDFKFSTQFVSTLIVAAFILFQVTWPRYRSILLQVVFLILVYVRGLLLLSNLERIG